LAQGAIQGCDQDFGASDRRESSEIRSCLPPRRETRIQDEYKWADVERLRFPDWAFNYHRKDGKALVDAFPKTDILLTHGPPLNIFDRTRGNNAAGCQDLRERLPFLRPGLHVFGHIHEARGAHARSWGINPEHADPPIVQNEFVMDADESEPDEQDVVPNGSRGGDETVFVNAATWPAGRGAWRGTNRVPFGGPGFQPVVVDLLD
ncbi:hypothetical protein H0H93_002824, partial [Arthromyces matolae]